MDKFTHEHIHTRTHTDMREGERVVMQIKKEVGQERRGRETKIMEKQHIKGQRKFEKILGLLHTTFVKSKPVVWRRSPETEQSSLCVSEHSLPYPR